MHSVLPFLLRVICLLLVIATGASGIAYADHGGAHGTHCIDLAQKAEPAPHQHAEGEGADFHHAAAGQDCVQHSCVAIFAAPSLLGRVQRLALPQNSRESVAMRPFLRAAPLHRPPIA